MSAYLRRSVMVVAAFASLVLGLAADPARAQLRIVVTDPNLTPLPIAVSPFHGDGGQAAQIGQDIAQVVADNLNRSGLFRVADRQSYIQDPAALLTGPRFADWRLINVEGLVSGSVQAQGDGRLRVEFRLWDVVAENQAAGLAYATEPENWRRIAHIISDAIWERVTGEPGYFDTRVVYVAESGPGIARVKRLAIMDQDGANHRYLTDGETLVLTPRFSPNAQEITYMAFVGSPPRPRVYLYNIDSGRQELLGDFPGMTFAPRFSPDGNSVVMSQARAGNSDIFVLDLRNRTARQLTSDAGIDTSPSFSPDGARIVFESDRGGSQQLYVMGAGGGGAQRITFGNGRYGSPVWSPRGDLIAFTRQDGGQFSIGVIRPDGSGERILASGYHMEGPTWAPNGRMIMYFAETPTAQGARPALRVVSIDGVTAWSVPTPLDGSDPAWSSLLQ